jgi:hypothetical protein
MHKTLLRNAFVTTLILLTRAAWASDPGAVVDDYLQSPGGSDSEANQMAIAPDGAIYVIGDSRSGFTFEAGLIRRSEDSGKTWTTIFQSDSIFPDDLAIDSAGNLFLLADNLVVHDIPGELRVYKSLDRGTHWDLVDHVVSDRIFNPRIAIDPGTGGIFYNYDTTPAISGLPRSALRGSFDSGSSWRDVDEFFTHINLTSYGVTAAPDGSLVWIANSSATGMAFILRGSKDGGRTFSTTAVPDGDQCSDRYPIGAFSSSSGIWLTSGNFCDLGGEKYGTYWEIFRQSPGGDVNLADRYLDPVAQSARPTCMAFGQNTVYVGGYFAQEDCSRTPVCNEGPEWLVRSSQDGKNWTNLDQFSYGPNQNSAVTDCGTDSAGNLYVVGWASEPGNQSRWIVKKYPAK